MSDHDTPSCRETVTYSGFRAGGTRSTCDIHHGAWPCPVHDEPDRWDDILAAHAEARAAETVAALVRHSRDQLVANLVAGGVSMYRVSKVLGVSESGVRKMVDRAVQPHNYRECDRA